MCFAIQSGYDLAHLAHLTAVLHACAQQDLVGVGVHELCYTPQRWEVDPWLCFRVSLQETLEEGIKYWRSSSPLKSLLILRQDVITSIHECFRHSLLLLFRYFFVLMKNLIGYILILAFSPSEIHKLFTYSSFT